jgi:hypothetical protein
MSDDRPRTGGNVASNVGLVRSIIENEFKNTRHGAEKFDTLVNLPEEWGSPAGNAYYLAAGAAKAVEALARRLDEPN